MRHEYLNVEIMYICMVYVWWMLTKQTYLTQTGPKIDEQTSGTTSRERKPGPLGRILSDRDQRYQETKISAGEWASVIPAGDKINIQIKSAAGALYWGKLSKGIMELCGEQPPIRSLQGHHHISYYWRIHICWGGRITILLKERGMNELSQFSSWEKNH
jgi:hypothetical protein